uniref:Uncharacterized protein n=1 Tax=Chelonoidis abingdonii TaxID=106734 RepID=A0A8C0H0F4_CHEAB
QQATINTGFRRATVKYKIVQKKKKKKIGRTLTSPQVRVYITGWVQWCVPVIPDTWEAKASATLGVGWGRVSN